MKYFIFLLFFSFPLLATHHVFLCKNIEVKELQRDNIAYHNIPNKLVIHPDSYLFENSIYDCKEEGLYRFLNPPEVSEQRIVYDGDIWTLLSSISWIHSHGHLHDWYSFEKACEQAKHGKLIMTCGSISLFTCNLLRSLGYTCRMVLFLTLDEWNSYDNGHTCVEVKIDDEWVLIDIDKHHYYKIDGDTCNAMEFCTQKWLEGYERQPLAASLPLAVVQSDKKEDYYLYFESRFCDEEQLRGWYQHACHVCLIQEGNNWYFNHKNKNRVMKYQPNFIYLDKQIFRDTFYK